MDVSPLSALLGDVQVDLLAINGLVLLIVYGGRLRKYLYLKDG